MRLVSRDIDEPRRRTRRPEGDAKRLAQAGCEGGGRNRPPRCRPRCATRGSGLPRSLRRRCRRWARCASFAAGPGRWRTASPRTPAADGAGAGGAHDDGGGSCRGLAGERSGQRIGGDFSVDARRVAAPVAECGFALADGISGGCGGEGPGGDERGGDGRGGNGDNQDCSERCSHGPRCASTWRVAKPGSMTMCASGPTRRKKIPRNRDARGHVLVSVWLPPCQERKFLPCMRHQNRPRVTARGIDRRNMRHGIRTQAAGFRPPVARPHLRQYRRDHRQHAAGAHPENPRRGGHYRRRRAEAGVLQSDLQREGPHRRQHDHGAGGIRAG